MIEISVVVVVVVVVFMPCACLRRATLRVDTHVLRISVLIHAVNQLARTKTCAYKDFTGPGDEKWNKTHAPQTGSVETSLCLCLCCDVGNFGR
jgi:hypothetical protein